MADHLDLDSFTLGFVRHQARQLVGRYGFAPGDQQEIEQRLLLKLTPHLWRADPESATWRALVTKTVRRQAANLVRDACAEKRDHRRTQSLNVTIKSEEGLVELGDTFGPREADARLGLKCDVASVIEGLPQDLREVCLRLQEETPTQVARDLGISRAALRSMLGKLRMYFQDLE